MTTHETHEPHTKAPKTPPIPPPTLCDCTVPAHVDNCPDCYGFGLVRTYQDRHVAYRPRTAAEAMPGTPTPPAGPCPTCQTVVTIEGYGAAQLTAAPEPKKDQA